MYVDRYGVLGVGYFVEDVARGYKRKQGLYRELGKLFAL